MSDKNKAPKKPTPPPSPPPPPPPKIRVIKEGAKPPKPKSHEKMI